MIVQRVGIQHISNVFTLDGLAVSEWGKDFGINRPMTYEEILSHIRSMIHVDGREVVDWMLDATASNIYL